MHELLPWVLPCHCVESSCRVRKVLLEGHRPVAHPKPEHASRSGRDFTVSSTGGQQGMCIHARHAKGADSCKASASRMRHSRRALQRHLSIALTALMPVVKGGDNVGVHGAQVHDRCCRRLPQRHGCRQQSCTFQHHSWHTHHTSYHFWQV